MEEDIIDKNSMNDVCKIPKEKLEEINMSVKQINQRYYHSENWEEISESFVKISERIKEMVTPIVKEVSKLYDSIMRAYSIDPEIRKCYGIYKRTRKR